MLLHGSPGRIDADRLHALTGWELKPEGLCKADRCVPLPPESRDDDGADLTEVARRLGMALVADDEHGMTALGPESGGRALSDAKLPELTLPDRNGRPFSLRSLRGTRFVMVAWASW